MNNVYVYWVDGEKVTKTIFNRMHRSLWSGQFILYIVSVPVITGSQRTLQELVALRVAYKRNGTKRKELTATVTYFNAKDSLPIYMYG